MSPAMRAPCWERNSSVSDGSSHFGLPDLRLELLLRVADPADLRVGELERFDHLLLGHLACSCLDHRQRVLRADDDEVEGRLLRHRQRRVDDELAVDQADAHGAHRSHEGQRRDHQRRRGAVDGQDVVRRDEVGGEDRADHLHLVPEALRPERPNRAVSHTRGEDGALRGTSFTLEETAGDLAGGVHALLDVDGEREEVRSLACFGRPCAVASTTVSPERTTTAPSACFASLPVSKTIS